MWRYGEGGVELGERDGGCWVLFDRLAVPSSCEASFREEVVGAGDVCGRMALDV